MCPHWLFLVCTPWKSVTPSCFTFFILGNEISNCNLSLMNWVTPSEFELLILGFDSLYWEFEWIYKDSNYLSFTLLISLRSLQCMGMLSCLRNTCYKVGDALYCNKIEGHLMRFEGPVMGIKYWYMLTQHKSLSHFLCLFKLARKS